MSDRSRRLDVRIVRELCDKHKDFCRKRFERAWFSGRAKENREMREAMMDRLAEAM
jgi:hypothetical protein